ncbi:probable asparagine--tRNA ligase, mitochondrial isoform X2 [Portunus trituberculatus]|uniref:probable asparagine--tRNA ligase, mitochondrial isoform X2 n=1 Tax=Portunus trituberculatus TaxID=210409 RepID=UPI001E1CE02D|nr:probable asparagine--tRNA ligase, mitochondrial isoform X2 [Portunus trituberculatus]
MTRRETALRTQPISVTMAVVLAVARWGGLRHGRSHTRIAYLLRDKPTERRVEVNGWVKAVRRQKERTFFDLDDGSCVRKLQVVVPSSQRPPGLSFHAAVMARGTLQPSTHPAQEVELLADQVEVVSGVVDKPYPLQARHTHPPHHLREHPHLRPRDTTFAATLRVRSQARLSLHQYFDRHGFTCVDTPLLTTNDCEGGGEVFSVQHQVTSAPKSATGGQVKDYFDLPTHLTVSGQLHLEAAASGLSKVYTFNPAFRADNSQTRHHLAEFWMVEVEEAFVGGAEGLEGLADRVEGVVKACVEEVVEKKQEDVAFHWRNCEGRENLIHRTLSQPFTRMTHQEAVDTLIRHAPRLSVPPPTPHDDLRKEHEAFLTSHAGSPVLVTHWPKDVKAFYMATEEGRPDVALALDLLLPQVGEVAGGGVREPSVDRLQDRLAGDTRGGLDWYLELRGVGGAPSGGFGLGFERLVQFILGVRNIKDVVLFPRSPGRCLG